MLGFTQWFSGCASVYAWRTYFLQCRTRKFIANLIHCVFQVNFNEPLSMLQRLTEEVEYSELLDKAAASATSLEEICYVAAFTMSAYSTTSVRIGKPFNPLLGETYEMDRTLEEGWRCLAEQVSVI